MNYHERPELSASMLKKLACSTALEFWAAYEDPNRMPMQPTDAMRQGSLVDCLITEPHNFERKYIVAPKCDRRTKVGKELWKEAQVKAAANCAELIAEDWYFNAKLIVNRLKDDPIASMYLDGKGQEPYFWHDDSFDVDCRYMPDIENSDTGMLVDLKKTRSANPSHFARQAYSLGYDLQIAHYAEGFKDRHGEYPELMAFLAYEWQWPHNFSVMKVSLEFLEQGRRRREEAIELYKECRGTGEWPSYGVHQIDPPKWIDVEDPASDSDVSDLELEGL